MLEILQNSGLFVYIGFFLLGIALLLIPYVFFYYVPRYLNGIEKQLEKMNELLEAEIKDRRRHEAMKSTAKNEVLTESQNNEP